MIAHLAVAEKITKKNLLHHEIRCYCQVFYRVSRPWPWSWEASPHCLAGNGSFD